MSWYVYLLRVQKSGALYCGISNNLEARMAAHRSGKGAKALRNKPFQLAWFMALENRSIASKYENRIKALSKAKKERLVRNAPQPIQFTLDKE